MAREFFKNLPSQETPFNASRWNGLLNGEEAMGSIVVDDITCKNLFDKNIEIKLNSNLDADGAISDNTGLFVQLYYISVKPNTTYTISTKNGNYKRIGQYDNSKTFISRLISGASDTQYTFTTASNCYYIRVACSITDLDSIQIEKGSVATNYVEHKEFDNDRQMITVTNSAEYTIATSTTQINLTGYNVVGKIGSKLTVGNTGVIIPAGYTKAIISGQIRYDDTTEGDNMFAYIRRIRGSLILSGASECPKGNRISFILSPKIVEVQEGDVLTLAVQNNSGARGKIGYNANASYTYMTVELIK